MNRDRYIDKIQGMLLAGAYGDALGAPHELNGLQGNAIDPLTIRKLALGCDFYHDEKMNQWSIWPPPRFVDQSAGIPTDDTAYRLTIFHPWMRHCREAGIGFAENQFRDWLSNTLLALELDSHSDWYIDCRNAQVQQWLEMFEAEEEKREAVFFIPDIPIVFGLFLYLELGCVLAGKPRSLLYSIFRHCTRLDQGYAGIITGISAAILAEATVAEAGRQSFGNWFLVTAEDIVEEVAAASSGADRAFAERLLTVTRDMLQLGNKLRSKSEEACAAAIKREVYDHSEWFNPRLKNFDPLLFWMQMVAATAYAGDDSVQAIRVLAGGAGDADTVPTVLGSLIGAYYGLQAMLLLKSAGITWGDELIKVQECLEQFFDITILNEAELFYALYRMQQPV